MKRYRVSLCWISFDDYIIEAESEMRALKKARELQGVGHGAQGEGGKSFREPHYDEVREEAE